MLNLIKPSGGRVIFEGKQIYYELHGGGRPLLLLNGIMMSCGSWADCKHIGRFL